MRGLVIGRAQSVWDEVKQAHALIAPNKFDVIVAVNVAGTDYAEQVHHWVTYHVLLIDHWVTLRKQRGYPSVTNFWTSPSQANLQVRTPYPLQYVPIEGGSSGLLGTFVALHVGCSHVVLAGIPMQADAGQYDTPKQWDEAHHYQATWTEHFEELRGKVRSFSGWTRNLLGPPTADWLETNNAE